MIPALRRIPGHCLTSPVLPKHQLAGCRLRSKTSPKQAAEISRLDLLAVILQLPLISYPFPCLVD